VSVVHSGSSSSCSTGRSVLNGATSSRKMRASRIPSSEMTTPLGTRPGLKRLSSKSARCAAKSAQTMLTFPPALDINALIGTQFIYNEEMDDASEAAFNANLETADLKNGLFYEENDKDAVCNKAEENELSHPHMTTDDWLDEDGQLTPTIRGDLGDEGEYINLPPEFHNLSPIAE
jgi:hypothetical protein